MIRRTKDWDLIYRIVTHPSVWPWVKGERDIEPQSFSLPSSCLYLVELDPDPRGIWCFTPDEGDLRIHANMLPGYRGSAAIRSARRAFRWVFEHTDHDRIVARVKYRHAARMCAWAGMARIGKDERDHFEIKREMTP